MEDFSNSFLLVSSSELELELELKDVLLSNWLELIETRAGILGEFYWLDRYLGELCTT